MNRREFIKYSAVTSLIAVHPTVALSDSYILIRPSGKDDTAAINAALKASARSGNTAMLAKGAFTISDTIFVPCGARLIGQGVSSPVHFEGGKLGVVVSIEEPHADNPIQRLYVKDRRFPVPFVANIG